MTNPYTRENVFGTKDNPAPDGEQKCPPEVRDALNAIITTPELRLSSPEGAKQVIDYFLQSLNRLGENPVMRAAPAKLFGYALTQTRSHFTTVLAQSGHDVEIKAVAVEMIPNKRAKDTDPETFTVQITGPLKSVDPEHPLRGWGTMRVQNIPSRDAATRIHGSIQYGSVYKGNGGFGKNAPKGNLPKGTSITVFLNGPGNLDLAPRPDGDAEWKDVDAFTRSYFADTPVARLLAYDGKSDATSPPQYQPFAVEGGIVSVQSVGGKGGRAPNTKIVLEDASLDMNMRRTFDGGLGIFLPSGMAAWSALQPGAIVRVLVSGRNAEYPANSDQPERGIKKGQKVKTVNWQGICGTIISDGAFSNGSVTDPGQPAVPPAPVKQTDLIG